MKSVKLTCQGCGADLNPQAGEKLVKCEYCGVTNALHPSTKPATPAAPPPSPPGGAPPPMRLQVPVNIGVSKKAGRTILLIVAVVLVAVVGGVVAIISAATRTTKKRMSEHRRRMEDSRRRSREAREAARERREARRKKMKERRKSARRGLGKPAGVASSIDVQNDRPHVADANGDGIPDIIVSGRKEGHRALLLAVLSGGNLDPLWSRPIAGVGRYERAPIFVSGELVLVAKKNRLMAFGLKQGEPRWSANLSDRISAVETRKGKIAVATRDGKRVFLAPGSGEPAAGRPGAFKLLPQDDSKRHLTSLKTSYRLSAGLKRELRLMMFHCPRAKATAGKTRTIRQGPFTTRRTAYGCGATYYLAYAVRKRGTQVPHIVGFHRRRGDIWRKPLLPPGEIRSLTRRPVVAFAGERAVVVFERGGRTSSWRARLVELEDGKKVWEQEIKSTSRRGRTFVRGVRYVGDYVYVRVNKGIHVLDAKSGKPLVRRDS